MKFDLDRDTIIVSVLAVAILVIIYYLVFKFFHG